MRTGRRRRRSTQAPATSPKTSVAMSSMLRRIATSIAPEPRTRIAARGSAIRVTSDPKIEIVAAAQTRTKAWLRQSVEANGLRTEGGAYRRGARAGNSFDAAAGTARRWRSATRTVTQRKLASSGRTIAGPCCPSRLNPDAGRRRDARCRGVRRRRPVDGRPQGPTARPGCIHQRPAWSPITSMTPNRRSTGRSWRSLATSLPSTPMLMPYSRSTRRSCRSTATSAMMAISRTSRPPIEESVRVWRNGNVGRSGGDLSGR